MQSRRAVVTHLIRYLFHLSLIVAGGLLVATACRDDPTAPSVGLARAALAVAGDSTAPEIVFLPPLGPRTRPHGVLDTTLAPSVVVCRLDGDRCGADTVARFAPPLRDSTGAIASGDTTGDTPTDRVTLAERAYVARWYVAALAADTAAGYRVAVALGDTAVGAMDVKIVPDGYVPPSSDTSRYAFVTPRRVLRVRFQIFVPPDSLTIVAGPGVIATPEAGSRTYRHGSSVAYQFDADSGYTNVLVTLDGELVSRRGRVVMNRAHTMVVSADRAPAVTPGDEWIVRRARAVMTAVNSVSAAQKLLDDVDAMPDTVDLDARLERVDAVVMATADSTSLRRLDAALTGHTFRAGTGDGSVDDQPPPPSGGGTPTARLVPHASLLGGASAAAGVPPVRGPAEPVTIGFVNGVLTTPFGALFSSNHVARLARAASWNANVPFEVKLIYNRTAMRYESSDLRERCILMIGTLRGLGWLSLPVKLAQCVGDRAAHYPHMLGDFVESAEQVAALLSRPSLFNTADADSVATAVTRWRRAGRHVVLVAHSQGNLMVQQGIAQLRDRGTYHPASDTTCIGAVSLASPMSRHWPIADAHLRGLVVDGDAILTIGLNDWPRTRTPLTDSADADANATLRRAAPDVAHAVQLGWAMHMHELIASYLRPEPMRTLVQDALVRTYRSCAVGAVNVVPRSLLLHPGETRAFAVTLADMNGDPLDGTRGIRWSALRDDEWQRGVTLDPSGTATGHYAGGTSVTVATRAQYAFAGVTVEPIPIVVSATEQFSARWALVSGGQINPGQPPTPAPPVPLTSWDGGSCVEKMEVTSGNWGGVYSKQCTAAYDVTTAPIPGAAKYTAAFSAWREPLHFVAASSTMPVHLDLTEPQPTYDPLPGPPLIDRIMLTVVDAAGHLLAEGQGCVHGCAPPP